MSLDQKMKQCKSVKSMTVVPYHLFTVLGEHFVFDTSGCRFYQVNEIAFDLLSLSLALPLAEAKKTLLLMDKYSKTKINSAYKEVLYLAAKGLFDRPLNYIDLKCAEKELINECREGNTCEIQLSLAENCNLACKYCYCSTLSNLSNQGLMSEEVAKKSIDFLMSQKVKDVTILLFGGEPLMNKPVIHYIMKYSQQQAKIHEKSVHYVMTTNATLLDDKVIDYFVNNNFGLMVSLDGPREVHDNQCPTKNNQGSYDAATANIKKIMERRSVGVRATIAHPMPKVEDLVDFFVDFGFSSIVIGPATNRKDAPSCVDLSSEDMVSFSDSMGNYLPVILSRLKQKVNVPYFPYSHWYEIIRTGAIWKKQFSHNCGAGINTIGIDSGGGFFPCTKCVGVNALKIGNFHDGIDFVKVKKIWLSFLKEIQKKCGLCWAYPVCHGPCLWQTILNDGSIKHNDIFCYYVKRAIEKSAFLNFSVQNDSETIKNQPNNLKEVCYE